MAQVISWEVSVTDDLALLRTATRLPTALPVRQRDPVPGDLVVAVGYPLSGPQKATRGRVLGLEERSEGSSQADVIQTTAEILPGNSGGPFLDTSGTVAGVTYAIDLERSETLVLPVSRVRRLLAGQSVMAGRPCKS